MKPRGGLATTLERLRIGRIAGASGEWMHYVAATWLAFSVAGTPMVALYLVAVALPGAFLRRMWPRAGFLPAIGALTLAVLGERNLDPLTLTLVGVGMGTGSALSGRTTAWVAGLVGSPTWPGVAGAAVAVGLNAAFGVGVTLVGAAALLATAWILPAEGKGGGRIPSPVVPAAAGLGFVVGLRLLEPALGGNPAGAGALAAAWAAGAQLGWVAAPRMDARIALAAPFAAGAAVAGMGILRGFAALFVYLGAAVCAGLIGGLAGSSASAGEPVWPQPRLWVVAGLLAGSGWAVGQSNSWENAAAGAAVAALAGGFISLAGARRVTVLEKPEAPPAIEDGPRRARVAVLPRREAARPDRLPSRPRAPTGAAAELQAALDSATSMRSQALTAYAVSGTNAVERARSEIRRVAEETLRELGTAADRVRRLSEGD